MTHTPHDRPVVSNRGRQTRIRGEPRTWRSAARSAPGVATALNRLGSRVRRLRLAAALSPALAAERAKLDMHHWRDIEAGHTNPTIATLAGVARALNIDIADLFDDE